MQNGILLHIGMPKTGSSYLQKFLAVNNEILRKNGWCYPDARQNFKNDEVSDEGRWVNGGLYPFILGKMQNQKDWLQAFDKFNENVNQTIQDYRVILSDESMWFDIEGIEFLKYLKKKYKYLQIIVYLRRQDMEIESLYAQRIKNIESLFGISHRECVMSLKEYYSGLYQRTENYAHIYDYNEKLSIIKKIVGKENISVFTYEETKIYGLSQHFVQLLGLDYTEFKEIEHTNVTLSVMNTDVKRKLNMAFIEQSDAIRRQIDYEYQKLIRQMLES